MIQSMTGFGKATRQLGNKTLVVEVKSLNSKNLDVNARMATAYREKELVFRRRIAEKLERGKVDFSLYIDANGERTHARVNSPVVEQYMEQLAKIETAPRAELLKMALRLPDSVATEREEIDDQELEIALELLEEALAALLTYRSDEGNILQTDFEQRIETLRSLLAQVMEMDTERLTAVRERLQKAVADLKENVDQNRFEQELIYYLEKYDITEEKVRLENHLSYFMEALHAPNSNGKKLGFITQEIGREINTIGSKANYAPMQQMVVQMKDELEKIKEQMLNVL